MAVVGACARSAAAAAAATAAGDGAESCLSFLCGCSSEGAFDTTTTVAFATLSSLGTPSTAAAELGSMLPSPPPLLSSFPAVVAVVVAGTDAARAGSTSATATAEATEGAAASWTGRREGGVAVVEDVAAPASGSAAASEAEADPTPWVSSLAAGGEAIDSSGVLESSFGVSAAARPAAAAVAAASSSTAASASSSSSSSASRSFARFSAVVSAASAAARAAANFTAVEVLPPRAVLRERSDPAEDRVLLVESGIAVYALRL